jgi:hypothetical protein
VIPVPVAAVAHGGIRACTTAFREIQRKNFNELKISYRHASRHGGRGFFSTAFPALGSGTLGEILGFNAHPLAIIEGVAAIFDISWRRTTERNQIGRNNSADSSLGRLAARWTADHSLLGEGAYEDCRTSFDWLRGAACFARRSWLQSA